MTTDLDRQAEDLLQEMFDARRPEAASAKHAEIAEELKARILAQNARTGNKELKKFEVNSLKGSPLSFITIEVGMIADEGTMAAVFCRDYRHIMIGTSGGLTLMNAKNKRKNQGWFHAVHALTK